ncbi:MAG: hypothetical protein ABI439_14615 [Rhodospirillales bacterium]
MRIATSILAIGIAIASMQTATAQNQPSTQASADPFVNVFPHPPTAPATTSAVAPAPPVSAPSAYAPPASAMAPRPSRDTASLPPRPTPLGAPRALAPSSSGGSVNVFASGVVNDSALPSAIGSTPGSQPQPSKTNSPYPPIPQASVPKSVEAQFAQCAGNSDAATPDAMLAACSAIVDAGREPNSRMAQVYANRARAWHDKAAYNAAMADFDQAIRLAPQSVEALQGRCMSRAVIGQLSQALADCNQALKLKPHDIASLESRGFTYRKMRAFTRSVADYDAVLQIKPDQASALFGRGVAKIDNGDRSGYADIKKAKGMSSSVAGEFGRYGIYR